MIIQTRVRDFVKLLHFLFLPIHSIAQRIVEHFLPFRRTTLMFVREVFCHPGNFSVASAEMRDSHILSSIFTSVLEDTASAACPSQPGNLATTSMIFGAVI